MYMFIVLESRKKGFQKEVNIATAALVRIEPEPRLIVNRWSSYKQTNRKYVKNYKSKMFSLHVLYIRAPGECGGV